MYLVRAIIAVRGMENDMEAEIVEEFREAMTQTFAHHQLTEVLVECTEELVGNKIGGEVMQK